MWFLYPWVVGGMISLWNLATRGEPGGSGTPSGSMLLSIVVGVTLLGSGLSILYRSRTRKA